MIREIGKPTDADWQKSAEAISEKLKEVAQKRLKEAIDDVYGDLLYYLEEHLKAEAIYNINKNLEHYKNKIKQQQNTIDLLQKQLTTLRRSNLRLQEQLNNGNISHIEEAIGQ
jgi:FtsZ-binding cell division protein ZapB